MKTKAIILGSIGVLAETADLQRRAYNQAFREAGINWHWDEVTFRKLLVRAGGRQRLSRLSEQSRTSLTNRQIDMIHSRKTAIVSQHILMNGLEPRPGVEELIRSALEQGIAVALATTTYQQNIDAIAMAMGERLCFDQISPILTRNDCTHPKPSPDVYRVALNRLGLSSKDVIAIEDSQPTVQSAKLAGIYTVATPGEFTSRQNFSAADEIRATLCGFEVSHSDGDAMSWPRRADVTDAIGTAAMAG